uniref:Uncharacterized protein n=1 Tax=Anguilla anguilla TaxID=7936 RepID=A0A0E9TYR7_ANGAN
MFWFTLEKLYYPHMCRRTHKRQLYSTLYYICTSLGVQSAYCIRC